MTDNSGSRSPKSLSDVSHLFFSKTDGNDGGVRPDAERPVDDRVMAPGETAAESPPVDRAPRGDTVTIVVTGWTGGPGKSTVAVNLACSLATRGSVGLFDADPTLPNARFYVGLPSGNYLSPLTGRGGAAADTDAGSGVCVSDWSAGVPEDWHSVAERSFKYSVVDVPVERLASLGSAEVRSVLFVVVAAPGWSGFEAAFSVLATLRRELGVRAAALLVNRAPSQDYAARFHSKMRTAAERLLSMEMHFLGGAPAVDRLGAEQRERGPIVRSRPDCATALSMREAAARAVVLERMLNSPDLTGPDSRSDMENDRDETDRTISTA